MNSALNRYLLYYPIQLVRGEHVWRLLHRVRRLSLLSPSELQTYQVARLRELVAHCEARLPYYRRLFREHGIRPQDIRTLSDLRRIPLLEKSHIRHYEQDMVDSSQRMSMRSTSGSSGHPLVFHKDRLGSTYMEAAMYDFYGWHGIRIGDRQARFWGRAVDYKGSVVQRSKDKALNRIRLSAFEMSEAACAQFYKDIVSFRPGYVYAYPNAAYRFALAISQSKLPPLASGSLKAVVCTGEMLLPEYREAIQAVFNCPVVNEYGSTENGTIAFECRHGRLHLAAHNLIVEFLRDGEPVADGEAGEVVLTELHSRSIPFLRYRIGDMGRPLSGARCDCGSGLPLMDVAQGRVDSFIIRPDGALVYDAILAYVLKGKVHQFQGQQINSSTIVLRIKPKKDVPETWEQEVRRKLSEYLGAAMRVEIEYVEQIPIEKTGKFRYFIPLEGRPAPAEERAEVGPGCA